MVRLGRIFNDDLRIHIFIYPTRGFYDTRHSCGQKACDSNNIGGNIWFNYRWRNCIYDWILAF